MSDPIITPGSYKNWSSINYQKLNSPVFLPFLIFSWLCDWANHFIKSSRFATLIESAGKFTVLIAVIVFFLSADDRKKMKIYQAWQVINTASSGSSGLKYAINDLIDEEQSLSGINLSNARLPNLNLNSIDLENSLFEGTYLWNANFAEAFLYGSTLFDAELKKANLHHANLSRANLSKSNLQEADLRGANLFMAVLKEADLRDADLTGAYLMYANLTNIMNWKHVKSIKMANIFNVKGLSELDFEWALKNNAVNIADMDEWETFKIEAQRMSEDDYKDLNLHEWWMNKRSEFGFSS